MTTTRTVVIDCFPESAAKHRLEGAIIAVDVIRVTTTIGTAASLGRECFSVPTLEAAFAVADTLIDPLLVGELGGNKPDGFDLNNSPAEIASRTDFHRPMVILSTSGTRLIAEAEGANAVYAASLRNYRAQSLHAAAHHSHIAVIGAGSRGDFREEDQLCCAWIASELLELGFQSADRVTSHIIDRWRDVSVDVIVNGPSAAYLRRTDQLRDLDFVMTHVGDLDEVYSIENRRVVRRKPSVAGARDLVRDESRADDQQAQRDRAR